jgi:hypothetical protein
VASIVKKVIHINQHTIRANKTKGENLPPITVKTYKSNTYARRVEILDKDGSVVATIQYQPENPLSCGATVWISTENEVVIVDDKVQKTGSRKKD